MAWGLCWWVFWFTASGHEFYHEINGPDIENMTIDEFLDLYSDFPVIIHKFRDPLQNLSHDSLMRLVPVPELNVYTGDNWLDVPPEQFIQWYLEDVPRLNLLEGITPPPQDALWTDALEVPKFFSTSWYTGVEGAHPISSGSCHHASGVQANVLQYSPALG